MALMTWDKRIEVGHPKIDEQHRTLVDAYNALHQAMKQGKGKDEVVRTLSFLTDYTVQHFAMEEGLMASHAYPGASRHIELHKDLVRKASDLLKKVQGGQALVTLQVMDFLEGWLMEHIMGEDFRLAEFLRSR